MKMKLLKFSYPFHLVTLSPWPLMLSFNVMNMMLSLVILMKMKNFYIFLLSTLSLLLIMFQWWRDVVRESTFQGLHTFIITKMMKYAMLLFILSELFFFISFFWTFFHNSISSSISLGMIWPPKSLEMINPYDIPLLNSMILISSGFTLTWSHYMLINNKNFMKFPLFLTIILGVYFTMIQLYEYMNMSFTFNDSVYGSVFYILTGFHGLHVNMGIIFLSTCLIRIFFNHLSKLHHLHFEMSSWYWHFVDVVWLFLYLILYWWMF